MPSVLYSKLLLAKLSLFVFGATFAEWLGSLLAYVAALFVTSICRLLSWLGWGDCLTLKICRLCSRSQIPIQHVAEFLIIRGLILLFCISHDRAAFRSCSHKCLRSPLCWNCHFNRKQVVSCFRRIVLWKNLLLVFRANFRDWFHTLIHTGN